MDIIKNCLKKPIIVYSLIILILFSGLLALFKIPIQLTPDVRKPVIEITTNWQGGSPSEVEREIVIKQEDVLKSVKGVERIRSNSYDKKSEIKLEFNSTKNFQTALLMASNALDRVRGMPEEIMKPNIETSGSEDSPIAWIMLRPIKKINKSMSEFGDLADNLVKTEFEKIRVSSTSIHPGLPVLYSLFSEIVGSEITDKSRIVPVACLVTPVKSCSTCVIPTSSSKDLNASRAEPALSGLGLSVTLVHAKNITSKVMYLICTKKSVNSFNLYS